MPHSKSAAKRLRQSTVARTRNRAGRQAIRTQVRKVRQAVESGDVAAAESELKTAVIKLDQAGARRTIHRNAAARTKSRLSAALKKVKQAPKKA